MNKTSKSPAITMCMGAGVEVKLFLKKDDGGSVGAVFSGQSPKQMSTTSVSVTQEGSFYYSGHFRGTDHLYQNYHPQRLCFIRSGKDPCGRHIGYLSSVIPPLCLTYKISLFVEGSGFN